MKFYDCQPAPSPRRARVFIAEKGLSDQIETVQVNLREGEQLGDEYRKINPYCTVPTLELDDGTRLHSSSGIWHYLEAYQPEPPLMGRDPRERGVVADIQWRIEYDGLGAVGEALRNSAKGMKGRALTGPHGYEQIPELGERGKLRAERFMPVLDSIIGDKPFVAGEVFSVADIDALVFVEFAGWVKIAVPDGCTNLKRWYDSVSQRPSAKL